MASDSCEVEMDALDNEFDCPRAFVHCIQEFYIRNQLGGGPVLRCADGERCSCFYDGRRRVSELCGTLLVGTWWIALDGGIAVRKDLEADDLSLLGW